MNEAFSATVGTFLNFLFHINVTAFKSQRDVIGDWYSILAYYLVSAGNVLILHYVFLMFIAIFLCYPYLYVPVTEFSCKTF